MEQNVIVLYLEPCNDYVYSDFWYIGTLVSL